MLLKHSSTIRQYVLWNAVLHAAYSWRTTTQWKYEWVTAVLWDCWKTLSQRRRLFVNFSIRVKMISTHSLIVHQIIISIKYNMQLKLWMRFNPHNLPKKNKTKSMNQERWKTRENWATEKGKTFHNYFIWHYYHYKTKDGQLHEKQMKIFLNIKLYKKKTDLCTYLPICTCITLLYMKT